MTIARTQYITIAELNEILGVATYTNGDLIKVYEASEIMKYHMNDNINSYTTSNAPTNLKIATAYQVEYMVSGIDDDYSSASSSASLGKYSYSGSTQGEAGEYNKISPKSRRYLIDGKLTTRII